MSTDPTASNSSSTYYGPVGETSSEIFLEKTFMASGYLTALGYGVQLVLYGACVQILWNRKPRTNFTYFLLGYITVLCAMNTIWTGTSAYGLQITYIDFRNYPVRGPIDFLQVEFSMPSNVISLASYIIGNVLADILLLWRCRVIWSASLGRKVDLVMIVPTLLLLASIAMAILFAFETASPAGFFSRIATNFALPYFGASLSLNLLLTSMIVARMSFHQRRGREIWGDKYGKHYGSISTIFIESAALYSIVSILLLVTYALNNPINQIWLGLSPSVQMVSSYLIIYRVVSGRAWTSETLTAKSGSMAFDSTYKNSRSRIINQSTTAMETESSAAIDIPLNSLHKEGMDGKEGAHNIQVTVSRDTRRDSDFIFAPVKDDSDIV